jgi:hypothetical protein
MRSSARIENHWQLESFDHEFQHGIPAGEIDVTRQSSNVIEECLAGCELLAKQLTLDASQAQNGVKQEGQQIEGQQDARQILLAMPKIVLEMIPFLEDIMALVLGLPPSPSSLHNRFYILFGDQVVGCEGIAIENFPAGFMGDGQLTPIDEQGTVSAATARLSRSGKRFPSRIPNINHVRPGVHLALYRQMSQKRLDFGRAHFSRMTLVVEKDKATNPLHVLPLCAVSVMTQAKRIRYLVQELLRWLIHASPPKCIGVVRIHDYNVHK